MEVRELRRVCESAIAAEGPEAVVCLLARGGGRTTRRRLWKAGPLAQAVEACEHGLVLEVRAADVLAALDGLAI